MEILILTCLLLVIVLLLQDKVVIRKPDRAKENNNEKPKIRLPDIMGLSKPVERLSTPRSAIERQDQKDEKESDTFDQEIKEKDFEIQIPQEELEKEEEPDLREEEEEWNRYGISGVFDSEDGFATGVTFEELGTVEMVLREKFPEPSLQKQAVALVHKIQGTELFSLLEDSVEGASRRIAELLDQSLSSRETDSGSSILRTREHNDFDIGEFL